MFCITYSLILLSLFAFHSPKTYKKKKKIWYLKVVYLENIILIN